jgi:hypothetical protein
LLGLIDLARGSAGSAFQQRLRGLKLLLPQVVELIAQLLILKAPLDSTRRLGLGRGRQRTNQRGHQT